MAKSIRDWFADSDNAHSLEKLLNYITVNKVKEVERAKSNLFGKLFVVTGSLKSLTRDDAKEKLEKPEAKFLHLYLQKRIMLLSAMRPGQSWIRRKN